MVSLTDGRQRITPASPEVLRASFPELFDDD
jgi:hypothetical protein